MKIRNLFAFACAFVLGASAVMPAAVCAAETDSVYEGLIYEAADNAVTVTGFTEDVPAVLTVPAEIDGLPVTKIGEKAFNNCLTLTEITLPDSVTELGTSAFKSCIALEKAVLPDGVTVLPESLFADCRSLTDLHIPANTVTIGNSAFFKCAKLAEIPMPETVKNFGEDTFTGTAWLTARREENPFVIVNRVVIDGIGCEGDITIPAEAEAIGPNAFAYNQKITNVVLPASVKSIARYGFYYCPLLESITILNPQCEIHNLDSTISTSWARHVAGMEGSVIRGYANSTTEAFAVEHGYSFELIYDPEAMPADLNCSGTVDTADAVLLARFLAEENGAVLPEQAAADFDGDGLLTVLDVRALLRTAEAAV